MVKQPPAFVVPDRDILDVCALGDVAHLGACLADAATKEAAVQFRDSLGFGALHVACTSGQYRCCEMLLAAGADVNQSSLGGLTPLMCAAANGWADIVHLLLAQPTIDVGIVSRDFETALAFAKAGRFAHLEVLLEPLTRAKTSSADVLEAAGSGDVLFVALALMDAASGGSKGKAFAQTTETGDNAVIVCTKVGSPGDEHLRIVDVLLKRKLLDVDAVNHNGSTALMYAARANSQEFAELLLSHGANACISASTEDSTRTASTMATTAVLRVSLEHAERKREFEQLYATRNAVPFDSRPEYIQQVLAARQRMLEVKGVLDLVISGQPDPRFA